jgi:hypothetical protein
MGFGFQLYVDYMRSHVTVIVPTTPQFVRALFHGLHFTLKQTLGRSRRKEKKNLDEY